MKATRRRILKKRKRRRDKIWRDANNEAAPAAHHESAAHPEPLGQFQQLALLCQDKTKQILNGMFMWDPQHSCQQCGSRYVLCIVALSIYVTM
jgi:hypothetical protein